MLIKLTPVLIKLTVVLKTAVDIKLKPACVKLTDMFILLLVVLIK